MRIIKYLKPTLKIVSVIIMLFILTPSVLAGSFKIMINPPGEPIKPESELRMVTGYTQLIPGPINIFKSLYWPYGKNSSKPYRINVRDSVRLLLLSHLPARCAAFRRFDTHPVDILHLIPKSKL